VEMDKRQKTMLGVLLVVVLGMGGMWYMRTAEPSGPSRTENVKQGKKIRKRDDSGSKKKSAKKKREKKEKRTVGKKVRDRSERDDSGNRKRRSKSKGKIKKKKIQPAA